MAKINIIAKKPQDNTIIVNGINEGTTPHGIATKILITDGVNPVTPDDVSVVGDTVTVEVPSGGGSFDVDLVDRFGNAFPTKQVTANATWDLRTLTPFDFADLYLNTLTTTPSTTFANAVISLYASGVLEKKRAIWLLCEGTAFGTALNLKYPFANRNSFQLIHAGSPTYASDGIQYDASSHSYTGVNPNMIGQQSYHFSIYSQTDSLPTGVAADMGLGGPGVVDARFHIRDNNANRSVLGINGTIDNTGSNSNSEGYYLANCLGTGTGSGKLVKNGNTTIISITAGTLDTYGQLVINGRLVNMSGGVDIKANRKYSLASVGVGLTDSEILDEYNAIQAFHTALGINK